MVEILVLSAPAGLGGLFMAHLTGLTRHGLSDKYALLAAQLDIRLYVSKRPHAG